MLRTIIIVLFVSISMTLAGQNMKLLRFNASNGEEYKVGSKVFLGIGSMDNLYFKYITSLSPFSKPPEYIQEKGFNYYPNRSLPAAYKGQIMEVKKIKQLGSEQDGYKVYLICGIDSDPRVRSHWVEIEAAIQAREVVLFNHQNQF